MAQIQLENDKAGARKLGRVTRKMQCLQETLLSLLWALPQRLLCFNWYWVNIGTMSESGMTRLEMTGKLSPISTPRTLGLISASFLTVPSLSA